MLERKDCKDYLSVFDCSSWQMVLVRYPLATPLLSAPHSGANPWQHFPTETHDAADVAWSPDTQFVAVWDCNLYYKVGVGAWMGTLEP